VSAAQAGGLAVVTGQQVVVDGGSSVVEDLNA
jgi:hypothetical protein